MKLSVKEIKERAKILRKRQAFEWGVLIFEAMVDRTVSEVATILKMGKGSVSEYFQIHAMKLAVSHHYGTNDPPNLTFDTMRAIKKKFPCANPRAEVIEYFEHWKMLPAPNRLASRAYDSAIMAIQAGMLTTEKKQAKLSSHLEWSVQLTTFTRRFNTLIRMIDGANPQNLKEEETMRQIAVAHAKWMEQVERIEAFHPNFMAEVARNDG